VVLQEDQPLLQNDGGDVPVRPLEDAAPRELRAVEEQRQLPRQELRERERSRGREIAEWNLKDQVDLATLDRANRVPFNMPSPTQCAEATPLCGLIGEILAPSRTMRRLTRKGSEYELKRITLTILHTFGED
jgi:hypothetical protein